MPVAAKLSRKLYEAFGEEAAEAMVDWMESVERNRTELREMNDLAFGRIDARFGESEERIRREVAADIVQLRQAMESGFSKLRDEMNGMTSGISRLEVLIAETNGRIDARFSDLLKWSFTFWAGSTLTLLGIAAAIVRWGH